MAGLPELEARIEALEQEVAHIHDKVHYNFEMMERSSFGCWSLVDANGIILNESKSSRYVLGWEPEELIGNNAFEWLHPDDIERNSELLSDLVANVGKTVTSILRWRNKDGSYRTVRVIGTNELDNPDINAIFVKITEMRW